MSKKIGSGNHSSLVFEFKPGNNITILIFSTAIEKYYNSTKEIYKNFENSINNTYYLSIESQIRNCVAGEIYRKDTETLQTNKKNFINFY